MSSSTEELVVKVTIYTQTHTHYTVTQLCTHVSVSSFLSGITGDSLPVSLSLTQTETNWGAEWDSGWCRCSYIVTVTTRVLFLFFFFFLVVYEAQSGHLPAKGKVGPPVKHFFFLF